MEPRGLEPTPDRELGPKPDRELEPEPDLDAELPLDLGAELGLELTVERGGLEDRDDCRRWGAEAFDSLFWAQLAGAVPAATARASAINNGPRVGWNLFLVFNMV